MTRNALFLARCTIALFLMPGCSLLEQTCTPFKDGGSKQPAPAVKFRVSCHGEDAVISPAVLQFVDGVEKEIRQDSNVERTLSVVHLIKKIHSIVTETDSEEAQVPESEVAIRQCLLLAEMGAGSDYFDDGAEFEYLLSTIKGSPDGLLVEHKEAQEPPQGKPWEKAEFLNFERTCADILVYFKEPTQSTTTLEKVVAEYASKHLPQGCTIQLKNDSQDTP